MKNTSRFFVLLFAFTAASCTLNNAVQNDGAIRFSVNVTKATDNSFENDDQISLFAGEPVNANNVRLTCSGSAVTPSTPLYWGEDQTTATVFNAVYPYNASYTTHEVGFDVKTDQSYAANYKASDLMTASTSQRPGNVVSLTFSHRLSKLNIHVTNNSGYTISGISAESVNTHYDCASDRSSGSASVKAKKFIDEEWSMILPPQVADGVITVSTNGGNYTFTGKYELYAGKSSDCYITISGGVVPPDPDAASFSCTVNDWGFGSAFTFTQDGVTPTPPPAGGDIFSHNFKTDGQGGFTINNVTMPDDISYVWQPTSSYGMKASAYVNGVNYATESWLVSPEIDLSTVSNAHMEIVHAAKFFSHIEEEATLMVRKGGTNWTKVNIPTYPDGSSWNFISSGDIDISSFAGSKIVFAFVYTSTSAASGTWEIESVKISGLGPQ